MIFPDSLNEYSGRPVITFHCLSKGGGSVTLPAPIGLQISDQANYGGVELGALGAVAMDTAQTVEKGITERSQDEKVGDTVGRVANQQLTNLMSRFNKVSGSDGATALALKYGGDIGKALGIARGVSLNPNITTEFTGTNVRSFSFQYKLVPSNQNEATNIGNMVNFFRENLYPEGNVFYLKYPSKWKITFQRLKKGLSSSNNGNLPKMGECYLSGFSSTYNSAANAFFEDGTPVETDISLSFTETKAFTKEDIKKLL